jgi:hypothetical protein
MTTSALPDYLSELQSNIDIYKESIREIAEQVLLSEVSKYPVFIAHKEAVALGRMVIDKEELALEWSISASTLEEFVARKIVPREKLNFFRMNYKNPAEFICLFVVHPENPSFIFVPYDTED